MDNLRSKNGTRELGRPSSGRVCEKYRVSLEQRIALGHIDLVCADEELCWSVETMLKEGDPREVLTAQGLDILAMMEDSLLAPPVWGGTVRGFEQPAAAPSLGAIGKAFEVLERAALNLYLYPWRKEYRVVKVFSGMFTHLVRPALSKEQVAQLFGLLGYQGKEAELELQGALPPAAALLGLACGFFAARCESRLLSTAAGGQPGAELTLVQERRKGHSLQRALESLREKTYVSQWDNMEDVDLYTDKGEEASEEKEVASAGKKLSTASVCRERASPPSVGGSSSVPAPGLRLPLKPQSQPGTTESLGQVGNQAMLQTGKDGMGTAQEQNQTSTCCQNPDSELIFCLQCHGSHNTCDTLDSCDKNKHMHDSIYLDGSKKSKHNPQVLGDAALRTERGASAALSEELNEGQGSETARGKPKTGGASAASWTEQKVEKASATVWGGPKEGSQGFETTREGRASGTQGVGLGMTCRSEDCSYVPHVYCRLCGFKFCEQCWIKKSRCNCGGILVRIITTSV